MKFRLFYPSLGDDLSFCPPDNPTRKYQIHDLREVDSLKKDYLPALIKLVFF